MTKYKDIEDKVDKMLNLSKETGKVQGFNICASNGTISTTEIAEGASAHPGCKDGVPLPNDPKSDVAKI